MDNLGKIANAKYATDGSTFGRGTIIGYCAQPTYIIEQADGSRFSWRCDLCDVIEDQDDKEKDIITHLDDVYNEIFSGE